MPIITAMSTAQIQMTRHLLQEMEAEGVVDLSQARERLQREEDRRRREIRLLGQRSQSTPRQQATEPCPECDNPLTHTMADGLLISACRACRWSAIVEG